MGVRWSVEQVMAAAPDSVSQVAGRGLARPGPWNSITVSDGLLWGECQGSGKAPYRVTVDTDSRRYQCSCPSRKFPCKHCLALLYLWAEGRIGHTGEIASFAGGVADNDGPTGSAGTGADQRSDHGAGDHRVDEAGGDDQLGAPGTAKAQTPALRAAVAARAAERERRVDDGLGELDRWLADQVSGGLARVAQHPLEWAETMAARMVDAQAPGVAAWLRRLPAVIASGVGWPARLLDELALLHLLICGYAARSELPDDLVATLRSHVGFTVPKADVLTGPAVRDRWAVVAFRDLDSETVSTRRVWLQGIDSGRWAQVLFFAAGGAGLDTSLVPATLLDADLHFYPGRARLRAVVGAGHSEPVPLTDWRPRTDTVVAAADRWVTALAADPWQHQIPVVLRGRLDPADQGWTLTDPAGSAITAHGVELDLWRLYAVTAGTVVDVAGEWSPRGFRPAAAVIGGRLMVL